MAAAVLACCRLRRSTSSGQGVPVGSSIRNWSGVHGGSKRRFSHPGCRLRAVCEATRLSGREEAKKLDDVQEDLKKAQEDRRKTTGDDEKVIQEEELRRVAAKEALEQELSEAKLATLDSELKTS